MYAPDRFIQKEIHADKKSSRVAFLRRFVTRIFQLDEIHEHFVNFAGNANLTYDFATWCCLKTKEREYCDKLADFMNASL